ncbi:DUF397 domain-containing protein [Streptomyces mayteni]
MWRKSSYSSSDAGECLETQCTHDALVAVGDSKDRSRGALVFSPAGWSTFVAGIRHATLSR